MTTKRMLCMLLAIVLLSAPLNMSYSDIKPILGVEAGDETQIFESGEKGEYELKIKNIATTWAQNIRVTIKGDHPFRSDVSNLSKAFSYLNPSEVKYLLFNLTVSPLAEPKLYEFDVLIDYEDAAGAVQSVTEKAFVRIERSQTAPTVSVVEYEIGSGELAPNVPNALALWLKNSGELDAKAVKVSISGFSNAGVLLYEDIDVKHVGDIAAKTTKMMYFNLQLGDLAKKGTTELKVVLDYIDAYGNVYSKESIVYVKLEGQDVNKPKLEIQNVVVSHVNDVYIVTADVVNRGQELLKTLEVATALPESFYSKTIGIIQIDALKPGEKSSVRFEIGAEETLKNGSYHGTMSVKVPDANKEDAYFETKAYLGLMVEKEADASGRPRLIVENYDTGREMVKVGEPFTLRVSIKNTSKTERVQNIKLQFTSVENQFITVDTSNAMFIDQIMPGGVKTVALKLKPNKNSAPGAYAITLDMAYEDSEGKAYDIQNKPYVETELLNIELGQEMRLELGDLTIPTEVSAGENFYIEQEFYNMGKAKIANLLIKQEGLESLEGSMFLGEFEAGKSDTYTAECHVDTPGTYSGKIIYQFEDSLSQMRKIEKPFEIIVTEAKPVVEVPNQTTEDKNEVKKVEPKVELWHVIVAFLILVTSLYLLKGKKKKRQ